MAGLSAGGFAWINGFETEILEMDSIPGAVCTAWKRNGYIFDFCIHWLCGSKPGSSLYRLYETLGMVQGRQFITPEYWDIVRDQHGHELTFSTDPDRLSSELLRLSPEDKPFIRRFYNDLQKFRKIEPNVEVGILDMLRFLPSIGLFKRYKSSVDAVSSAI